MVENDKFGCAASGRFYKIKQRVGCTSKYVVYVVNNCKKCNVQYVGSTTSTNEFKVRFRNHKSAMNTGKKTCEVAIHFGELPTFLMILNSLSWSKFLAPIRMMYC